MLAAVYLDFLWRQRQRHVFKPSHAYALSAIVKYEHAARERVGDGDLFWDALLACRQLARLGVELNNHEAQAAVLPLLSALVETLQAQWSSAPGMLLEAADVLCWMARTVRQPRSVDLVEHLRSMARRVESLAPVSTPMHASVLGRDAIDQLIQLEDLLGLDTRTDRLRQRADSLVAEAELRSTMGDDLGAAEFMSQAATQFTTLGLRERAGNAKQRSRELYSKGFRAMKPLGMTVTIPAAPMRHWLEEMCSRGALRDVLHASAQSTLVIPSWAEATDSAKESAENHYLQAALPATTVVDGRPVERAENGRDDMVRRHYLFAIKAGVRMWATLIAKLKNDSHISSEGLITELDAASVLATHNREATARALGAAFAGDAIIACHMLPAIVESTIRVRLAVADVDMTALRPQDGGTMQERTMGALFDPDNSPEHSSAAIAVLGDDLWNWYRLVLFDEAGFNLRNRAAHGMLRDEECSEENTYLLLLALVALLQVEHPVRGDER